MPKKYIPEDFRESDEDVSNLLVSRYSRKIMNDGTERSPRLRREDDATERQFSKRKLKRVRNRTH